VKLRDFLRVEALVNVRNHLIGLKDEGRIEISISGQYQNRDFVDQIDPAIRLELRFRINEIEQQLIELGVAIE
jgi:hypothetical protein